MIEHMVETRIMFAYSARKEHRECHARIFDVKTGDDFRFTLGNVKWRAVGLRHAGDQIHQEKRKQRNEEPVERTVIALLALLTISTRFRLCAAISTPTSAKPIAIS